MRIKDSNDCRLICHSAYFQYWHIRDDVFFEADVSIPIPDNEEISADDVEANESETQSVASVAEQLPVFEVLSDRNYKKLNAISVVDVVSAEFYDPESQEIYASIDSEDPIAEPVSRLYGISVGA